MNVARLNYEGNPHIGLFIFCNDKLCIIGSGFRENQQEDIHRALGVPLYNAKILGSNLVGLFIAGNNKGLVVPEMIEENELKHISDICAQHDMTVTRVRSKLNALGNNIICNDAGGIINPEFSPEEKREISEGLHVPIENGTIASFQNVGSLARAASKGVLLAEDILPEEEEIIEKLLQCKVVTGSINNSPYISSGLVVNHKGYAISDQLFGGEVLSIKDAFFQKRRIKHKDKRENTMTEKTTPTKQALIEEFQKLAPQFKKLKQNLEHLEGKLNELRATAAALEELGKEQKDVPMYVPVAQGLFVKARLEKANSVLMNVGAGVAVEKSCSHAQGLVEKQFEDLKEMRATMTQQVMAVQQRLQEIKQIIEE